MLETMGAGFMPAKAAAVLKGGRPLLLLIVSWLVVPIVMRAGEPLVIEWAYVAGSTNGFNLRFNRPVNPHTATNLANYQLGLGVPILAIAPQYGTNLQEYVFTIAPPGYAMLSVNGVADFSTPPQVLANAPTSIQLTDGWQSAFYYGQVNGGPALFGETLAVLFAATNRFTSFLGPYIDRFGYPGRPDYSTYATSLESGPGMGTEYGVVLSGFISPPESGRYIFFLSAGSQAAMFLSSSSDPYEQRLVAVEPSGNPFRDYLGTAGRTNTGFGNASFPGIAPDEPVNRSDRTVDEIVLAKGKLYFVEVLAKFGNGPDHVSVAWQTPTGTLVINGTNPIGRPYLSPTGNGRLCCPVSIVQTNIPTAATEGGSISLSTIHSGAPPIDYQWFRDGQPIPDATNRVYTIERVTLDLDGASFACRIRNYFSEASTDPLQTAERPTLGFVNEGNQRFLVWPASYWDFIPQSALELDAETEWNELPGGVLSAREFRTPIPVGAEQLFFRAMKSFPAPPPQP